MLFGSRELQLPGNNSHQQCRTARTLNRETKTERGKERENNTKREKTTILIN
jgi:hypothetical protein